MLLAGRQTHNNKACFNGFEGIFMGLIMGSQNVMGSDYGSNISEVRVAAVKSMEGGSRMLTCFVCAVSNVFNI